MAEITQNTTSSTTEKEEVKYFSQDNIKYLLSQLTERLKEKHINE